MDIMPFYLVFLQSLPESAIVASLGLILIGVKPRLIPIFFIALIVALASRYIRALPFPAGYNIMLQLVIFVFLIKYLHKLPFPIAVMAASLGFICVTLTEMVFNGLISIVTGISVIEAIANPLWRLLFPLPEFIFLTVIILALNHYKITIFNLSDLNEMELKKHEEI